MRSLGGGGDTPAQVFSGLCSQVAIQRLRAAGGETLVGEVLAEIGERRSARDLEEHGMWLSYWRLRRLLEAAGRRLGGPDMLGPSARLTDRLAVGSATGSAQDLGSPNDLLLAMQEAHKDGHSPICRVQEQWTEQIDGSTWRYRMRLVGGVEPYRELCNVLMSMLTNVPAIFGITDFKVTELACQCDGAEFCEHELHWDEGDLLRQRLAFSESRVQVLEQRLASVHQTVAEIVSDHELGRVLKQVVRSAAIAVGVPGFVLALGDGLPLARRVYSHGVSDKVASRTAEVAADALAEGVTGGLVAEVRSPQRHYGWLVAVGADTFILAEQQKTVLDSYARLAAKALDSAVALDTSRREATTARALLGLARALGQVSTVEEVAQRLAGVVRQVIDCDRALVLLTDSVSEQNHIAATTGYDEDTESHLRGMVLPASLESPPRTELQCTDQERESNPWIKQVMADTGSAARANVPIMADGRQLGVVVATVTERPERLSDDPALGEKLEGLAAQAAIALRNAELVDRISHQATHDILTGLPNRMLLEDRARHGLAQARRQKAPLGLLFVDLDRFKNVNDSLGHDAGDELIREVSVRLSEVVRAGDTVARTGGDEFVILLPGLSDADDATAVAAKVLDQLKRPFCVHGQTVHSSASIGVAVYPHDGNDYRVLLQRADAAMYAAKTMGGVGYSRDSRPQSKQQRADRILRETELRRGLETDELTVFYQPQVRLDDSSVIGAEALIRWRHPGLGLLSPSDFLPIAEECGLMPELDALVRRLVFAQVRNWQDRFGGVPVAVNVSARSLNQPSFVADVASDLVLHGINGRDVEFEITEDLVDDDVLAKVVEELSRLGVGIAIDDFGKAASGMNRLQGLPVQTLKTDRSLLAANLTERDSLILAGTIRLAHDLGIRVVAEGVERQQQSRRLLQLGCDSAQGYLFGRPMAAADFENILCAQLASLKSDRAPATVAGTSRRGGSGRRRASQSAAS